MDKLNELVNIYSPRDEIFKTVLDKYIDKETKIFQIGAIETLDNPIFRVGSGWSDIIFGKHIKQYGGILSIVDISIDHLANSNLIANYIGYNVNLNIGNAIDYLDDSYDIYYLDGSNDPKETLDQFSKVLSFNKTNIFILIDDFAIKGTAIDLEKYPFKIYKIEKGLGVLYNG